MSDFLKIDGIGLKKVENLKKLGLENFNDALTFFPRSFEDRTIFVDTSNFTSGQKASIVLEIAHVSRPVKIRGSLSITTVLAFDDFSNVEITFFNQDYISNLLKEGTSYTFYGVIRQDYNKITVNTPKFEKFTTKKGKLLPIYKLVSGLNQADVRKVTFNALKTLNLPDILPDEIVEKYRLAPYNFAVFNMHYPKTIEDLKQAKRRIDFEKLFLYLLKLRTLSASRKEILSSTLNSYTYDKLLDNIPFSLTAAQQKCLNECIEDIKTGFQLNRLLQGDVGSGKTIVATILSYLFASEGRQTAFVVPTEILANQHFNDINELFEKLGISMALLTGSTKSKDKKIIKSKILSGEIKVVIGTHAVFTDDVVFSNLSFVVVDEQHRFGVAQRAKLLSKGENPHTLVMSATPIPRTMSLILYGDLDISIIDEMPKGRQPIDTFLCDENKRKRVNNFINTHILNKNQVYIVCPLIEENEEGNSELKDATKYFENLQKTFPEAKIGLIHGKIKPKIKDEIMNEFASGHIDILVSTTVIEVGVNVPNATLMIIENAERFGLSTLHQLRGRVGRGKDKSYCILMSDYPSKRLEALTKTRDGFEIAREDLALRGAGDYYGYRQSGESGLSMLDLDIKMLECASNEVNKLCLDTNWTEKFPLLKDKIQEELTCGNINIFN